MKKQEIIKYLEELKNKVNNHYAELIDDSPDAKPSLWDSYESSAIDLTQKIDEVISLVDDFDSVMS